MIFILVGERLPMELVTGKLRCRALQVQAATGEIHAPFLSQPRTCTLNMNISLMFSLGFGIHKWCTLGTTKKSPIAAFL